MISSYHKTKYLRTMKRSSCDSLRLMSLRDFIAHWSTELTEYYDEDFDCWWDKSGDEVKFLCLVDDREDYDERKDYDQLQDLPEIRKKLRKAGKWRRDKLRHQWSYVNPLNRIHGYVVLHDVTSRSTSGKTMALSTICATYFTNQRGIGTRLMNVSKSMAQVFDYKNLVLEVANGLVAHADIPTEYLDDEESEEESEEELDDELVNCENCERVWDGRAQCPCGMDIEDSDSDEDGEWYPDEGALEILTSELWKKCMRKENDEVYYNLEKEYIEKELIDYFWQTKFNPELKKVKYVHDTEDPYDWEYGGFWYNQGKNDQKRLMKFYEMFGFEEDSDVYLNWRCMSEYPYPSMRVKI